jgi:TolB-like protein
MGLITELRRRNVFRMAVLYVVAAWVVMQVAGVLMELGALPSAVGPWILAGLVIGFPIALVFSWLFEITPEGLTLEKDVPEGASITHITGRRMDFIVISMLSAAVILFAWHTWWPSAPTDKSIAVLPFTNASAAEENAAFFANGIHDEILTQLARIASLKVISRASVMEYRDSPKNLREIGAELGVTSILDGQVLRAGNRLQIKVQLINAETRYLGKHVQYFFGDAVGKIFLAGIVAHVDEW